MVKSTHEDLISSVFTLPAVYTLASCSTFVIPAFLTIKYNNAHFVLSELSEM